MFRYTGNAGTYVGSVSVRFQALNAVFFLAVFCFSLAVLVATLIFHPISACGACSSRHSQINGHDATRRPAFGVHDISLEQLQLLFCSSRFTHMFITIYRQHVHHDLHTTCSSRFTHNMFITIYTQHVHHDLHRLCSL